MPHPALFTHAQCVQKFYEHLTNDDVDDQSLRVLCLRRAVSTACDAMDKYKAAIVLPNEVLAYANNVTTAHQQMAAAMASGNWWALKAVEDSPMPFVLGLYRQNNVGPDFGGFVIETV